MYILGGLIEGFCEPPIYFSGGNACSYEVNNVTLAIYVPVGFVEGVGEVSVSKDKCSMKTKITEGSSN